MFCQIDGKTRTPSWPKKDFAIDVNFYKGGNKKVFCINLEQIGRKLKKIASWYGEIRFHLYTCLLLVSELSWVTYKCSLTVESTSFHNEVLMWASLLNDLIQCSQKGKYFAKSLNEKKKSLTQIFSLTFTMAGHESVRNYI